MKIPLMIACAAFAAPAMAQDWPKQPATINVTGEGLAEVAPDRFSMSASVNGRGATQVEALRSMAEAQTTVTNAVTRLRGLTWSQFSTGSPAVQPIYAEGCEARGYGRQDGCEVTGYVATTSLSLKGAPAERAGDAVSIAAERGARDARLTGYSRSDDSGLRRDAARAAFADARRQAEIIADASGQRIVRVSSVNLPQSELEADFVVAAPMMVTQENLVETPSVSLTVAPEPIRVQSRLAVQFEVE